MRRNAKTAGLYAKRRSLLLSIKALCLIAAGTIGVAGLASSPLGADGRAPRAFDRGDNALWMRRHWLHEAPGKEEIAALAEGLRARGIKRIYPFLGPMDQEGWPGWRSKRGHIRYIPGQTGAFLAEFHRIAPEIRVLPWTGGNSGSDVRLDDENQRRAFAAHARQLIRLGADGVHLNVEPVPSGSAAFLSLLREVKAAIGEHTLSVAASPPRADPEEDTHWELPYLREVCRNANEIAVMAYDTGLKSAPAYEELLARWTHQLAQALPPPSEKGCEWLMGVSAYDDDNADHRPDVETIGHSLNGIAAGLRGIAAPANFRGVAIYASLTMDAGKWAVYDRLWRGIEPVALPPIDPRNTSE